MTSGAVECYSGHAYGRRPRAVQWGGERFPITAVLSQWRTPHKLHYVVRAEGERSFILRYAIARDEWEVEML